MIKVLRRTPGGKFFVTPIHRFVVVSRHDPGETLWYVAGRLAEPFLALTECAFEVTEPTVCDRAGHDIQAQLTRNMARTKSECAGEDALNARKRAGPHNLPSPMLAVNCLKTHLHCCAFGESPYVRE